jgi:hypothetical protein
MNNSEVSSIIFAGDYHAYGAYNKFISKNPDHDSFADVELKEMIHNCDLSIFNLENPITDSTLFTEKFGPHGTGSDATLRPIFKAGFNIATMATNHSYDARNLGIRDTINACACHNIETVGAGLTSREAKKVLYKKIKSHTIALLNFSRVEFNIASSTHGGANPLEPISNAVDIRNAKKNADLVFVVIHEGVDLFHLPYPKLVKQMRFYADMGADGIVIHHSRYVSGYEIYNDTPIFYGLGNLLNLVDEEEELRGIFVKFEIETSKKLSFKVIPIELDKDNIQVSLSGIENKSKILSLIEDRSNVIKDKEKLDEEWQKFVYSQKDLYLSIINNSTLLYRIAKRLNLQSFLSKVLLFNKRKYLGVWNIFRCQSHFEATNQILDNIFSKPDE